MVIEGAEGVARQARSGLRGGHQPRGPPAPRRGERERRAIVTASGRPMDVMGFTVARGGSSRSTRSPTPSASSRSPRPSSVTSSRVSDEVPNGGCGAHEDRTGRQGGTSPALRGRPVPGPTTRPCVGAPPRSNVPRGLVPAVVCSPRPRQTAPGSTRTATGSGARPCRTFPPVPSERGRPPAPVRVTSRGRPSAAQVVMATMGALRGCPPIDPMNGAFPKAKIPPSEATS